MNVTKLTTDRQTDRLAYRPRYSMCSNRPRSQDAMWPNNISRRCMCVLNTFSIMLTFQFFLCWDEFCYGLKIFTIKSAFIWLLFLSGLWVQCRLLCPKWCCVCWSWWKTIADAACCCTGDTQLGSVSWTFMNFVGNYLTISKLNLTFDILWCKYVSSFFNFELMVCVGRL